MTTFFLRSRTGRRYKNSQQCVILFRPGSSLTNPVSILSEYKESPKHVQSSLGAHTCRQHCARKMKLELWSLEPNPLNKGSQQSLDKMSHLSHKQEKGWHATSPGQVAEMAKCSRPSHPILHANVVLQLDLHIPNFEALNLNTSAFFVRLEMSKRTQGFTHLRTCT